MILKKAPHSEWATPQAFFDLYAAEFEFTLDVAATAKNAKCARFFTKADDGLAQDWSADVCWMNPPYGREIGAWVKKAYEESLRGATVVCLIIPVSTDVDWWHEYTLKGEIRFAVVIFRPPANDRLTISIAPLESEKT